MSTTRIHGRVVFSCDECAETFEPGTSDFDEARSMLENAEWRTAKIDGEWYHFCETCPPPLRRQGGDQRR